MLANFLPVLMSCLISVVGMNWDYEPTGAQIWTNIWTVLMLSVWLLVPIVMVVILFKNRK